MPSMCGLFLTTALCGTDSPSPPSQSTSKCKYRHGAFSFPLPPAPKPLGKVTLPGGLGKLADGKGGMDGDCAYVGSE